MWCYYVLLLLKKISNKIKMGERCSPRYLRGNCNIQGEQNLKINSPKAIPHDNSHYACHFFSPVKKYSPILAVLISPRARSPEPIFVCITRRRDVIFGILHSPGQKQYWNTPPSCCGVIEFLVPFPLFILVFRITSPAHKVLNYTPPFHQCCWWGTPPITIYFHSKK